MTSDLVELGGSCQTGRAAPDDGHLLPRPMERGLRLDPPHLKGVVNNGTLNVLDGHWRGVDAQNAGPLHQNTQFINYKQKPPKEKKNNLKLINRSP